MKKQDDFMLPTSDFCFKQLLGHPQIRKGFLSALLEIDPKSIQETILLPTIMEPPRAKGKISILDFNLYPEDDRCYRSLALCDVVTGEISSDMFELKIMELKKKPVEDGTAIVDWIRFFSGTSGAKTLTLLVGHRMF